MSLRGYLSGTAHGTAPDNFPTTTGIVHRIRLVTQHYTRADEGGWLPVADTIALCDLQHSPRWFTDHPKATPTDGTPWILESGVLLDLAVRSDPVHSAGHQVAVFIAQDLDDRGLVDHAGYEPGEVGLLGETDQGAPRPFSRAGLPMWYAWLGANVHTLALGAE